jgi:hypothetical protein
MSVKNTENQSQESDAPHSGVISKNLTEEGDEHDFDEEAKQLVASYAANPGGTNFRTGIRMIYVGGVLGDDKIRKYGNQVVEGFRK